MKKVLVLLLLLSVACGGSSEETALQDTTTTTVQDTTTTTVQDTTTTTVPPAPTSDTNYVELYNTKLGTELCSDAKEIDTTTEECLRQYKENLNYLITLQNEIGNFGSALIAYYETYPELVNQEYEDYINFVENEYSQVFTTVSTVEDKYVERFGGVPVLQSVTLEGDIYNNCKISYSVNASENLKSGYIEYTNQFFDKFILDLKKDSFITNTYGGTFSSSKIVAVNYFDEEFQITIPSNIENINVQHWNVLIDDLDIYQQDGYLYVDISYKNGYKQYENLWLNFLRFGLDAAEAFVYLSPNEILTANGEMLDNSINRSFYKINLKTSNFLKNISSSSSPFYLRHLMFYSVNASEPPINRIDINRDNSGNFDSITITNLYGCNGKDSVEVFINQRSLKLSNVEKFYQEIANLNFVIDY